MGLPVLVSAQTLLFWTQRQCPTVQWLPLNAAQSLAIMPLHLLTDYLRVCLQGEIAIIGIRRFCRDRDDLSPLP